MPNHYVYDPAPDKKRLCQGDVLQKTEELTVHLRQFHPHYSDHDDYKFFVVLTQSCDLVKRGSSPPGSRYITLAAARPVEEALRREAAKRQLPWQIPTNLIGTKARDKLLEFLHRLLDNNEDSYFYFHEDLSLGIQPSCCAFLRLSVALKIEHYDMCLRAKVAQLTEPFQAKLGYLLGHMYARVATTEWDLNYADNKLSKVAADLLDKTYIPVDDGQIKEGINELKQQPGFETKTPNEIAAYISQRKVISRREKFQARALEVLRDKLKPVDVLAGRGINALRSDVDLTTRLDQELVEAGIAPEIQEKTRTQIIGLIMRKIGQHISDQGVPDREAALKKLLNQTLQDPVIKQILQ